MPSEPTVFVVDDDGAVRRFLYSLISSVGLRVTAYSSAQEFLDSYETGSSGCVLLDIRMPGMSGLELQRELVKRSIDLPIIFVTGHGDLQLAVNAMKAGAVDFIQKPFNNDVLLDQVQKAIIASVRSGAIRLEVDEVRSRVELLSPRERQVFNLICTGETNKGVARKLGIAERTVEIHRAKVMEKMQAKSLASVVRMKVILDTPLVENH